MGHYEERLENDLKQIRGNVNRITELVETALRDAMKALLEGNTHVANMTVLRDNRVNRLSRRIDGQCHAFIAKHLPGAGHLRWISSVIRLNVALERVGDYAVTISRESLQLASPPKGKLPRDLANMAIEAQRLLHESVEAFVESNADRAAGMLPMTERIESTMDDIYAELIDAAEDRTPREIVATFVVFSLLKRVSDQAKNICEQTIFAVVGERKKTRPFSILFVDNGNNERSLMAQGIARKNYPEVGIYRGAAPAPTAEPDADVVAFLDSCGIPAEELATEGLGAEQQLLQTHDIVICLQKDVSQHVHDLPFHTTELTWDVDEMLEEHGAEGIEARHQAIYRYLKEQLDELMGLIADRRSAD